MKIIHLAFLFFAFSFTAAAQQKVNDKAEIKLPGLLCENCKEIVERTLFKQYGIISYKVDAKKKIVTVAWITDRTDIEQIKAMIATAGFDADDVKGEPTAYKRLPACCRKETYVTAP